MFKIEVTDTFGGESNYSWVRRGTTPTPPPSSSPLARRRALLRAVRDVAGWPAGAVRVTCSDYGDSLTVRPQGLCQIAFVTWGDE